MVVQCNLVDCKHNCGLYCVAGFIKMVLISDAEGIGRNVCSNYQADN